MMAVCAAVPASLLFCFFLLAGVKMDSVGLESWHEDVAVDGFSALQSKEATNLSTDAAALLAFKNAVEADPLHLLTGWQAASTDPCAWYGVSCSSVASQRRVTGLNLAGARLTGQLQLSMLSRLDVLVNISVASNFFYGNQIAANLSTDCFNLQAIDLSSNQFDGPLPAAMFSGCLQLAHLNLSRNNFSGTIPANLASRNASLLQLLDLSSNSLSGEIPAGLFSSASGPYPLRVLNLSGNHLTGLIPQQLFHNCTTMQVVDLSSNSLSGRIPSGIGKCLQLRHLNLSANYELSGEVPADMLLSCSAPGSCALGVPSLQVLDLSRNNLTGPLTLFDIESCPENLAFVALALNSFSGQLSLAFNSCLALETLDVSHNSLTGAFPSSVGYLPKLRTLHVSANNLSGSLLLDFGATLPQLRDLDLSSNNFEGPVPSSLSRIPSLVSLHLGGNYFSGDLPTDLIYAICAGEGPQVVRLGFNLFRGELPESLLSMCPRLKVLDLSSNMLTGAIPRNFCPTNRSSALEVFAVAGNNISGTIPSGLANCIRLRTLDLSFNSIGGVIPPELGTLEDVEFLYLWKNQLTGSIPGSLGNCRKLKGLVMSHNLLSGGIPRELSALSELWWLSISDNLLDGDIPAEIGLLHNLTYLQLANNMLTGVLPVELKNCRDLIWLDAHSNQLTGTIPSVIGRRVDKSEIPLERLDSFTFGYILNLDIVLNMGGDCRGFGELLEGSGIRQDQLKEVKPAWCTSTRFFSGLTNNNGGTSEFKLVNDWRTDTSLEMLDLSYNSLTGPIPEDFGNMTTLRVFVLAHNHLDGSLPDSLGNLQYIQAFVLSNNNFTGSIPPSYGQWTTLQVLDLSNNGLSGPIPSGTQFTTFPAAAYANNSGLCGQPILPECGSQGAGAADPPVTPNQRRRNGPALWLQALLVSAGSLVALGAIILIPYYWHYKRHPKLVRKHIIFSKHVKPRMLLSTFNRPDCFLDAPLLGQGGSGRVFKAILQPKHVPVAVKVVASSAAAPENNSTTGRPPSPLLHVPSNRHRRLLRKDVLSELQTLGAVRHRNLVQLLAYLHTLDAHFLIYEFMANGSLHSALARSNAGEVGLDWPTRLRIAQGTASGLAYLHHQCKPQVVHRDIKPANVLLDHNWEPHIGDFGLAKMLEEGCTHATTHVAGTLGYIAPEYYQSSFFTTRSDIYSLGVTLGALFTGREPTDNFFVTDFPAGMPYWLAQLAGHDKLQDAVDPRLRELGLTPAQEKEIVSALKLVLLCVALDSSRRPDAATLLKLLQRYAGI